jgi:uncharacterized membrane protein SpoIIM required for sporulation
MTPDQFVRRRQRDWDQLERLLKKAGSGHVERLNEQELRTLGSLYRGAASDLALAQRDFPRHDVTAFLNTLVGRAHHLVYRGGNVERGQIRRFLTAGFPLLFRRNWRYIAVAVLLLFAPWFIGWGFVLGNPELAFVLAPGAAPMLNTAAQEGKLWIDIPFEASSFAGAMIMTNNIQVTFLAFAGGMLAGLFTIYVLLMNGIQFGAVFGFVQAHGLGPDLWEFVVAHAFIELTVICIAGGAGLRMGHAMVVPGLMRRRDAIAIAAREALGLITGGALLLIIAGLIEGFISPSPLPWTVKAAVGVGSGVLLFAYLLRGGQGQGEAFAAR